MQDGDGEKMSAFQYSNPAFRGDSKEGFIRNIFMVMIINHVDDHSKHFHPYTLRGNFTFNDWLVLRGGRKPENPEQSNLDTGSIVKLYTNSSPGNKNWSPETERQKFYPLQHHTALKSCQFPWELYWNPSVYPSGIHYNGSW